MKNLRLIVGHRGRRGGSAIVFVIVTLAMMTVLGAAYLQNARIQRVTAQEPVRGGNIDVISEAVIAQIATVLREDLLDDDRPDAATPYKARFFNVNIPDIPANQHDQNVLHSGGGDEPYDYPYTRPLSDLDEFQLQGWVPVFQYPAKQGDSNIKAAGGYYDDMWLASTKPDFSNYWDDFKDAGQSDDDLRNPSIKTTDPNGYARWRHLTNLNGIYLTNKVAANDNPADLGTGAETPTEYAIVSDDDSITSDSNIRIVETDDLGDLVDADGDGIGDSRWTWAPIREMGGVAYVMAVRIIDNSSMVNANVALSQVDVAGSYDLTSSGLDAPRWWSPSELDLGRLIYLFGRDDPGGSGASPMTRMSAFGNKFLEYRLGVSSFLPTPFMNSSNPDNSRDMFWLNGARYYGAYQGDYKALSIQDELELRYRNGVNNLDTETTIESKEYGLGYTLRQQKRRSNDSGFYHEDNYEDFPGLPSIPALDPVMDYFDQNPRVMMTVTSGASIFAPPLTPDGNSNATDTDPNAQPRLKYDINGGDNIILETDKHSVAGKLSAILANPTFASYFQLPSGYGTNNDFALQFAVNIIDYADYFEDGNNTLTEMNGRYGFEALPFITEVYVQGRYRVTSAAGVDDDWDVTWTQEGNPGFAIEIRNPFDKPISLWNVHLWIDGERWGVQSGASWRGLNALAGKAELKPNEVLVLYRPSNDGAADEDDVRNLVAQEPGWDYFFSEVTPDLVAKDWPTNVDSLGEEVTIELRAAMRNSAGAISELSWGYTKTKSHSFPNSFTIDDLPGSDPTGNEDYLQRASIGNGKGINMLAVLESDITIATANPDATLFTAELEEIDALGIEDKTGAGGVADFSPLTDQQLLRSDRSLVRIGAVSYGKIAQVGELAHIAILPIGPNTPRGSDAPTLADALREDGDDVDLRDFMLRFETTDPVNPIALVDPFVDHLAVPHAGLLLDQFTTHSPEMDLDGVQAIDNDDDGLANSADPDEQFVPGTINLNTISGDLYSLNRNKPTASDIGTPIRERHLLQSVLPIPDRNVRDDVIAGIVKYRDRIGTVDTNPYYRNLDVNHLDENPNRGGLGGGIDIAAYRDHPGIASLGELFEIVDRRPSIGESNLETIDRLAKDGVDNTRLNIDSDTGFVSTVIDFLNQPVEIDDGDPDTENVIDVPDDEIIDDREEEATLARWLMQVCSTRSDIFTAYVIIQGYPADDFTKNGGAPVESARFFAVFDRSRITGPDDSVRILGVYRLN